MCPLVSGITTKDAALSFELGMRAIDLAVGRVASVCNSDADNQDEEPCDDMSSSDDRGVLRVGGHLVIKLLESEDAKGGFVVSFWFIWLCICYLMNRFDIFVAEINQICKPLFAKSSWLRPKATRPSSREIYLICQGLKPEIKI